MKRGISGYFYYNADALRIILPVFLVLFSCSLWSADWPQWRGPERNGISSETNLLKFWPQSGPKIVWSYEGLGAGFSSVSVANGFLYVTGETASKETLFAFDLDGTLRWKTPYGPLWRDSFPAVRTTPTIDGDYIYVHGGMGDVVCFDATSGEIKWKFQSVETYNAEYHNWGIAESPLIVDNKLICTPGGEDASIVALDKLSGTPVWQSKGLSEASNYCSPILVKRGSKKIIVSILAESFVGLDATNGTILWRDKFSNYQDDPTDINPVSPVYHDGFLFATSGYNDNSAMYKISGDGTKIKRIWVSNTLDTHIGGVVIVDGYLYGSNWENNRNGNWVCLDMNTGKVMYEKKWITKGSIIAAEGMLYCYEEKEGNLALVEATPQGFNIVSSFAVPLGEGQHWAHPTISDGRLYLRHGDALMVYDIKAP